ncbi:glycosyltransferase [Streptomyces sp. NPDC006552]|uniref:glycosyltransferase family 2 protein n=1 Tax=Streptomyces sp. NPDC006552 TaxID=3157179 RepID=UPI0033AEF4A6
MKISLIVPVHTGRGGYAAELIREALSEPVPDLELVIVDSSVGEERKILAKECQNYDALYLAGPKDAASKRNIGAHAAVGEYLLFVDSDCLISPDSIRNHIEFMDGSAPDVAAAIGPTLMIGNDNHYPWTVLRHSLKYNQCYDWPDRYERVLWGTTSNLVVRRNDFLASGGFRPMLPAPVGGEDVDFGVRLTELGRSIATNPDAKVRHRREHITSLRPVARSLYYYGVADAALATHHPARSMRHFPSTAATVGAGAAMTVLAGRTHLGWKGGAIVGAATGIAVLEKARRSGSLYTATGTKTSGRREWLRWLPARCLDAVFDLGVTAGAIRAKRPVLALRRFRYVNETEFREKP